MKVSTALIRHLEALAALRLSETERQRMQTDLDTILDYMRQLEAIDTSEVPPTAHVVEGEIALRADELRASLPVREILKNAPDARAPFFRVPRFLGDREE